MSGMMRAEIVQQLLALNREFYGRLADAFAQSRARPQPGFFRLLAELPQPCPRLLDVGCGEGRFGRFLQERQAVAAYVGVDFSVELLAKAHSADEHVPGVFYQRDMSRPGFLDGLGQFAAIACLAAMQHIPGRVNRLRLLTEMREYLQPDGRLMLANWQFTESERQRRKIKAWSKIGLAETDVEANDYLLTWQRGGFGLRYVCLIDERETAVLAGETGLQIINQFRSDGKEGNLSLYTVLKRD